MRDHAADALQSLRDSYRMPPVAALPELPSSGISLSRWRRDDDRPSHLIEHRVPTYTLSLILRPMAGRAWIGSLPVWAGPIHADTIRLTPPGSLPRWRSDGTFDFLLLTIPPRVVEEIAGENTAGIHDRLRAVSPLYIRDPTALQIGHQMLQACTSKAPFARQFADGLGHALVAHLLNHYADGGVRREQTPLSAFTQHRIARYVRERMGETISVADLAKEAGLSESHFAHAFRASTGMTPHGFITSLRLRHARDLLLDDENSIGRVARDCGFRDASHFSRVFRRHTGVTPRAYRRSAGQGNA